VSILYCLHVGYHPCLEKLGLPSILAARGRFWCADCLLKARGYPLFIAFSLWRSTLNCRRIRTWLSAESRCLIICAVLTVFLGMHDCRHGPFSACVGGGDLRFTGLAFFCASSSPGLLLAVGPFWWVDSQAFADIRSGRIPRRFFLNSITAHRAANYPCHCQHLLDYVSKTKWRALRCSVPLFALL